jgi:hypothetical protein
MRLLNELGDATTKEKKAARKKKSKALLRRQAQDFVAWLRKQEGG